MGHQVSDHHSTPYHTGEKVRVGGGGGHDVDGQMCLLELLPTFTLGMLRIFL